MAYHIRVSGARLPSTLQLNCRVSRLTIGSPSNAGNSPPPVAHCPPPAPCRRPKPHGRFVDSGCALSSQPPPRRATPGDRSDTPPRSAPADFLDLSLGGSRSHLGTARARCHPVL